jgi:hypothetical protein
VRPKHEYEPTGGVIVGLFPLSDHRFEPRSVKPKTMKIFLAASPLSTLVLSSCSKNWFGIRIMCLSGTTFLTKKISQFLFLGVEDIRQDKKKSTCIFPEKIYS